MAYMLRLVIKEIAESKNINRSQLQRRSGVTLPLLDRYWHNKTKSVTLEALESIANVLEVEPSELILRDEVYSKRYQKQQN